MTTGEWTESRMHSGITSCGNNCALVMRDFLDTTLLCCVCIFLSICSSEQACPATSLRTGNPQDSRTAEEKVRGARSGAAEGDTAQRSRSGCLETDYGGAGNTKFRGRRRGGRNRAALTTRPYLTSCLPKTGQRSTMISCHDNYGGWREVLIIVLEKGAFSCREKA